MSDFITQLRHEANELLKAVDASPVGAMFDGTASKDLYIAFLQETFHHTRPTSANLAHAGERLNKSGQSGWLADLLMEKSKEEKGHEKLALADLVTLGLTEKEVENAPESPPVAAYNAYCRFIAASPFPIAYLGPAYVLETLAVERGPKAATGMNKTAKVADIAKASVYLGYGGEDAGHVSRLDETRSHQECGRPERHPRLCRGNAADVHVDVREHHRSRASTPSRGVTLKSSSSLLRPWPRCAPQRFHSTILFSTSVRCT